MAIFRLYTGKDNQSHIEEQSLSSHPVLTTEQATAHIQFREIESGTFSDWHTAPRRQYLLVLSGQLEIGLKDGTLQRFNAGDVVLASDTTGSGHTTRVVGSGPAMAAIVPLAA